MELCCLNRLPRVQPTEMRPLQPKYGLQKKVTIVSSQGRRKTSTTSMMKDPKKRKQDAIIPTPNNENHDNLEHDYDFNNNAVFENDEHFIDREGVR